MDDSHRSERSVGDLREAESGGRFGEQDASFEAQARHACDEAARRYHAVRAALEALDASVDGSSEHVRQVEDARLHVEAARLAWFNTVVHYERVKARRRAALLG